MRGFPWASSAILAGSAVFSYSGQAYLLIGLMLFLPLADRGWSLPVVSRDSRHFMAWGGLALVGAGLLLWQPGYMSFTLSTLLFTALPEEWFFRAYLMASLGGGLKSNLMVSLLFSLVHGLTRGWTTALLVFIPSLAYGWLYQRSRDLPLVVMVHALSNLIYAMFLAKYIAAFLGDLR